MTFSEIKKHISDRTAAAIQSIFSVSGSDSVSGAAGAAVSVTAPPQVEMGDFTIECFPLAKSLKQAPPQIATALAAAISADEIIDSVVAVGPYVNFKIKNDVLFGGVVGEILLEQWDDKSAEKNGMIKATAKSASAPAKSARRVMVEYLSPNTNKPLHLGHLRNGALGMSLSNIFHSIGDNVIKTSIINDRGIHVCKSMLAWKKWGNGETPESTKEKGDHFVGRWYVRFAQEEKNNPALIDEVQDMLRQWEQGDAQVLALWKQMRQWVLDGFNQTNELLGFRFDIDYFESDVYEQGKDIVERGLAKGVFRNNEKGNAVFDLPVEEFGKDEDGQQRVVTVLRPDGTSLYTTQDLGLAVKRMAEYHLNKLIYVVGSEQTYHFKTLFAMLAALGYEWADKLYHLSYGMVYLPEGKMKSREGTVVDADALVATMRDMARGEIKARDGANELSASEIKARLEVPKGNNSADDGPDSGGPSLPVEEIERRSLAIGLAAIKFYLLRTKPGNDIYFDPKESISFEGFTGPYCQYSYARAKSIVRQAESEFSGRAGGGRAQAKSEAGRYARAGGVKPDFSQLGSNDERELLRNIATLPQAIQRAAEDHNPSHLATHVFETAQSFNQFYGSSHVLKAEPAIRAARLSLVQAAAARLRYGLELLGIEVLEEM